MPEVGIGLEIYERVAVREREVLRGLDEEVKRTARRKLGVMRRGEVVGKEVEEWKRRVEELEGKTKMGEKKGKKKREKRGLGR